MIQTLQSDSGIVLTQAELDLLVRNDGKSWNNSSYCREYDTEIDDVESFALFRFWIESISMLTFFCKTDSFIATSWLRTHLVFSRLTLDSVADRSPMHVRWKSWLREIVFAIVLSICTNLNTFSSPYLISIRLQSILEDGTQRGDRAFNILLD